MNPTTEIKKDVYSIATSQVLEYLEQAQIPWLKSWTDSGIPQNLITRKPFRAINIFLLAALGYSKNFFVTPKQLQEMGGTLKKGEKGHIIFYWKWNDQNQTDPPVLRYYYTYNIAQCDGIKKGQVPKIEKPSNPLETCLGIVGSMPQCPTIQNGNHPASYFPTEDCIEIPSKDEFPNDETYFCSLFRMLIRSTGHEKRLNRKEVMEAKVTDSALHRTEDLIGEIGAAHLASLAGIRYGGAIDPEKLSGWIEKFKKDSHLIVYASTQAQRAVDFILNRSKEVGV